MELTTLAMNNLQVFRGLRRFGIYLARAILVVDTFSQVYFTYCLKLSFTSITPNHPNYLMPSLEVIIRFPILMGA